MNDENKRIDINDLPRAEEDLTDEEAKGVSGGGGANFLFVDGSVRNTVDGSLSTNKVDTIGGSRTETSEVMPKP